MTKQAHRFLSKRPHLRSALMRGEASPPALYKALEAAGAPRRVIGDILAPPRTARRRYVALRACVRLGIPATIHRWNGEPLFSCSLDTDRGRVMVTGTKYGEVLDVWPPSRNDADLGEVAAELERVASVSRPVRMNRTRTGGYTSLNMGKPS